MRITAIHFTEEGGETLVWLGGEGVVITIKTKSKQEADRIAEAVEILINGEKASEARPD